MPPAGDPDDPEADEILTVGQTVTLWISKGPQTASMDDLTGQPQTNAEALLRNLTGMNLNIQVVEEASETVEEGKVIRTEPRKGATADGGPNGDPLCEHRKRCGDDHRT